MSVLVLVILSIAAAYALGRFVWPFVSGLIIALVLAMLTFPAYRWLCGRIPNERIAALTATFLLVVLVMIPVAGVSTILFTSIERNVESISAAVADLMANDGTLQQTLNRYARMLGLGGVDVSQAVDRQAEQIGGLLAGRTLGIMSGLGGLLVQTGVAIFTLYYLFADGPGLVRSLTRFVPLDDELTTALVARAREIIFATVYGQVVVAIVQGVLGGLVWWALGLPAVALWGTVMLIFSLLPALGPPLVWGPAALILLFQGEVWRAVVLTAVGALVIGTIDNVLRAYLVSDRAQLHPLAVFFSVLGGLVLFGVVGLFLGPMVFVIALSILEVTRRVLNPNGV